MILTGLSPQRAHFHRVGGRGHDGRLPAGPWRAGFGRETGRKVCARSEGQDCIHPFNSCQSLVFQRRGSRHVKGEDRSKVTSRSIGLDTALSHPAESRSPAEGRLLSPSRECWMKEKRPAQPSGFSGLSSSDSVLRELDDGQFDQEDGVTQVTCMWAKKESHRGLVNNNE